MAAIPTILKGDDSGAISITMATGRTYTGATLVVAYQGVTRSFANLTPGQTITITFTHEETANFALKTAPMLMRLIGQYGAEETVENAEARIRVTDCLAEVNAGGSFIVQPGGSAVDPTKVPITDVGDMAARYTLADLQAKVNQIVRVLAQRSLLGLLLSACCLASFGAVSTQTARLDALYNDSLVVTNVTGGGDVTHLDATNAALAVVGPVTNALTSVSNAAVSAYTVATNAQPRLTSANAGANIAITPYAYKWNVYDYPKYTAVYSHGIPTSYCEPSGTYPAYEDEACTVRATIDGAPFVKEASMVFESDYGRYYLLSDDLIEGYRASNDTAYVSTAVYISAPTAQITGNIVTNISASSDDTHYPSAKAAYEAAYDCATNAAAVATSDMETQTHATNTYQAKGDYATKAEAGASATNVVAGVTNNLAVAIGYHAVAVHKYQQSPYPVAVGCEAKATNRYSTAIGYMAHSHGNYSVNFQQVTNSPTAVGSLSQIYFGDFTLRKMVTNDTQLWQDCASYSASSSTVYVALQNSVQGVVIPNNSTMTVSPPPAIEGRIRDWVVDCICDTNTTVVLTNGLFKAADNTVTNIAAGVPTTLYFSESPLGFIKVGKAELKEGL